MRDVIVSLGGHSLREARACAHRFLERTGSTVSLESSKARSRKIPAAALKIERERLRHKVKATGSLRAVLLGQINDLRASMRTALGLREDDASTPDPNAVQAVLDRVNAALSIVDPAALAAEIYAIQQQMYQAGLESAASELGLSFDVKPQRALDALYRYTLQFSRNVVDRELVAIKDALMAGIDAGESSPEIALRVQNAIDDGIHILADNGDLTTNRGMPAISSVSGEVVRVIPADTWAEMVARTEVTRAMQMGVNDTYAAAGVKYVMFLSAEDERTCAICLDMDGEVFPADDDEDLPPVHASCRCNTVSADPPDATDDTGDAG